MSGLRAAALLFLLASVGPPAAGDWLVMRDGSRVETRGPWEVKGRQVVFTLANGTLSALRATDVDLEASAAANREDAAAPAGRRDAASPPRKPVLVLTDEDFAPPETALEDDGEDAEDAGGAEADAAEEPQAAERDPVRVVTWNIQTSDDVDGLEILGKLRNTGEGLAAGIRVTVTVPGQEGEPDLETRAFLRSTALAPGQTTGFRVVVPGIYSLLGDPVFEVRSEGFGGAGPAEPASDDAAAEPSEAGQPGDLPPRPDAAATQ